MSLRYRFFCGRLLGVCLFLSIVIVQVIWAQGSGTIKGQVVDQVTNEPLPGATVVVLNSSIGSATDLDGYYILRLVPAGTWKLKISYVGYRQTTLDVTITDNGILQQNVHLTPQSIMGEEVIVTAQARGQQAAINQQLTSDKIVNIVSEARIQELPDFNAAAAISRLPGISTQESSGEASKIVIRGLAPQYNAVAVGGIALASTGSTQTGAVSQIGVSNSGSANADRSVDLTMVTSYMIKSIEVFKSLTPDMNANAIGGYVNMSLREAPSAFHSDFMWQSGYTQKTGSYGNFRTIASVSDRFFDDKIGAYFLISAEKYDRDADNMTAGYDISDSRIDSITGWRPVAVNSITLNRHVETRKRFGGNLILDYKFSTGVIRSINMFSRLNSLFQDHNVQYNFPTNQINFTLRDGDGYTDLAMNSIEFENDFGFISVELKVANTYSRNEVSNSHYYQFHQDKGVLSGSSVPQNTLPELLVPTVTYFGDTTMSLDRISILLSDYKENDQIVKGDFKVPINIASMASGHIKFGGEYRRNNNVIDQSAPYTELARANVGTVQRNIWDGVIANFPATITPIGTRLSGTGFSTTDTKLLDSFLDDKFGKIYWACNPSLLNAVTSYIQNDPSFDAYYAGSAAGGWFQGLYQTLPNDYDYTEKYYAGYLMSQINIGTFLMVVGGVRYEEVKSTYIAYNLKDARDPRSQRADTVTSLSGNHFLLPMVQVKIKPFDWIDFRYSYSHTLARPAYTQLSPHISLSYDKSTLNTGNPRLRPAQAVNHDLIATLYSNELGLLSIGGFYKEIKDFAYGKNYSLYNKTYVPGYDSIQMYYPYLDPSDSTGKTTLYTTINSPYTGYVSGYEIDLQTRFWYLPFPFNGILLGANYTHIWSKTRIPWTETKTSGTPRTGIKVVQIDSSREVRMINQANDIANAFIGYEYKGFSARVSFVFQGNSINNYGRYEEQEGYTKDYYRVDFSARQNLPWGIQLFLDVTNINNRKNEAMQASINGFTTQRHYGMVANLGVRYAYSL